MCCWSASLLPLGWKLTKRLGILYSCNEWSLTLNTNHALILYTSVLISGGSRGHAPPPRWRQLWACGLVVHHFWSQKMATSGNYISNVKTAFKWRTNHRKFFVIFGTQKDAKLHIKCTKIHLATGSSCGSFSAPRVPLAAINGFLLLRGGRGRGGKEASPPRE